MAFCSSGERGCTFLILGVNGLSRLILWSDGLDGGTWSMASLINTKEYSENSGGKSLFGLCIFSSGSKLGGSGDFGNIFLQGGSFVEKTRATANDPVEDLVVIGVGKELRFLFPSIVLTEFRVSEDVDMNMFSGTKSGSLVEGVVMRCVSGVGEVEFFGLVQ